MPQIAQFEAPRDLGLRPTNIGVDATAAAARRLQADYNAAAAATEKLGGEIGSDIQLGGKVALEHMDAQQISAGAVGYAGMTADVMKKWDDTVKKADPNDPTVAAKFQQEVLEPQLQEFKDKGFYTEGGQKWAEAHVEQLRTHMFQKTSADMSTLAGEAAKVNYRQTTNAMASAVARDPSSLDFMLKTYESTIGTSIDANPNLTGTAAAKVKTELLQAGKEAIVKSAIFGMIEKNPNVDLTDLEQKYGEFVTGPEMRQFAKAAQAQARVDALRTKQTEIAQKQLDVAAVHQQANKVLTENITIDPVTNRPIINPKFFKDAIEVAKMPNAPDGLARTLIDWGESQQNKDAKIVTDGPTRTRLLDGMFNAENPTTKIDILRAAADNKLSPHDTQTLSHLHDALEEAPLKGPLYHGAMDAAKAGVGHNVVIDGPERYNNFLQVFIPEYIKQKRAGTLPPNALDTRDPESMISKAMSQFKPSAAEMMSGWVAKKFPFADVNNQLPSRPLNLAPGSPDRGETGKPETVPPASRREKDKTYQTPAGPRKWTGTGWVNP